MSLLEIDDLRVGFDSEAGLVQAVDGVSLDLEAGQTLGLVGESGCGKSVTASSILRLVPSPPGRILGGAVRFEGRDVLQMSAEGLSSIRGKEIAMIFQDPMTSLNPVFTIERQLGEVLELRFGVTKREARTRSVEMLQTVGIADPDSRLGSYPHELSGGMKQRVMIAMALLREPKLLIADEPTTALDVTIQAQILYLIKSLQQRTGAAVLFITHDMGVIAETCQHVAVMYAGRIVEQGEVVDVFERCQHPYTRGLLRSVPTLSRARKSDLPTIEGVVPSLVDPPSGCRFVDRCGRRMERNAAEQQHCVNDDPQPRAVERGRVACHFPLEATGA